MGPPEFLQLLGDEISDVDEESFSLFTSPIPSSNLGYLDPKASSLSIALNNSEVTIAQSPTLLASSLPTGTTGAVLWKVTPLFASWIASPSNPLFSTNVLGKNSTVLELGAGVSGLVALATAPRIGQYVVTDQEYVMRLARQNIAENIAVKKPSLSPKVSRKPQKHSKQATPSQPTDGATGNITLIPLDWETSSISSLPSLLAASSSSPATPPSSESPDFDAIIACDCIYNEALIPPFVRTCVELCQLRSGRTPQSSSRDPSTSSGKGDDAVAQSQPTLVLIAQQLRSHLVFEEWLGEFSKSFRVWRVPGEMLGEELQVTKGFVVHVGVLRA